MIDRAQKFSLARQAKLLAFSRSSVYYSSRPVSVGELALMRRIDKLHLEYQLAGIRMFEVGHMHVATLMEKISIKATYRRPNCGI